MKTFKQLITISEGKDRYIKLDGKDSMEKLHDTMGDDADELGHEGDIMIVPSAVWKSFQKAIKKLKYSYKEVK